MQIKQFWIFYYKFLAKVGKKDTYPNYDVQTLEYRYISKLPMKNERKNPISCLGGVALTRYMPSFFS
jgi:hypothetical protein